MKTKFYQIYIFRLRGNHINTIQKLKILGLIEMIVDMFIFTNNAFYISILPIDAESRINVTTSWL